ncbi:MAG: hypothetical protein AB1449_12135 [Chloroflexota bacterium]
MHLAAASERGRQEAQRFVELAGGGPQPVEGATPLGGVIRSGRPALNVPAARLKAAGGGIAQGEAAEAVGIQALTLAPLQGSRGERRVLVFAAPRTLAVPRGWAAAVAVATRYASLALSQLPELRIAIPVDPGAPT